MCSIFILNRPGTAWPVMIAANRDEMSDRPWQPPGPHWPDRPGVVAGLDELAGGTWFGLNEYGLMAAILNRRGSLGPSPGKRSRGELPLEALDHAEADAAALALSELEVESYRPFNMVIADARAAYWLAHRGEAGRGVVEVKPLPPGLSMITAADRNDLSSPRIAHYLPIWQALPPPDPDARNAAAWERALGSGETAPGLEPGAGPREALCIRLDNGFATSSSTVLALPADPAQRPWWRFAPGPPDVTPFGDIAPPEPTAG